MKKLTLVAKITGRLIRKGIGHNCTACPVAFALNDALAAAGRPDLYAWVEPQSSMWRDALGIELRQRYTGEVAATTEEDDIPSDVADWVIEFDDWWDVRGEGWREYRKRTGAEYRPLKPRSATFRLEFAGL